MAVNIQTLLDGGIAEEVATKVAEAMVADTNADAAATALLNARIAQLGADLAACRAGNPPPPPPGDTTAPSAPTGLVATGATTSINLAWTPATDNVGVVGYVVYRNGVEVGRPTGTSFSNTGLTAATAYSFAVKARDAAGNMSVNSTTVSATTSGTVTPPPPTGWPNASTTGVRPGVALTAYTGPSNITVSGTKVIGKRITSEMAVSATNVSFIDCEFVANGWWGINGDQATGLIVDYCTFKGPGAGGLMAAAVLGAGTFTNLNISGTSFGLNIKGKSTVQRCFIHDLAYGAADPHYDGIMVQGGNFDTLIEDNFVSIPGNHGTAGILITPEFGSITNVIVRHNRFLGGPSYQAYSTVDRGRVLTGVQFLNNEMERGAYGYWYILGNTPVRTGNKDAFTGANIDNA